MKEVKLSIDTGTFIRFWLVILAFVAVGAAVWYLRGALMIILISFFLALALNRPVSFFARHMPGRSRALATLIAYLLIVALIGLVFFTLVPIFIRQIANLLATLPETLSSLEQNSHFIGDFLAQYNLTDQYNEWLKDMSTQLSSIASTIGGSFVGILSSLVSFVVNLVLVLVLTFLMLIEGPVWEEKFWRLVYSNREKRQHHQSVARKMYEVVGNYISAQAIVAAISATLTAVCIAILTYFFPTVELSVVMPAWLVIFLTFFIPMFGATIGGAIVTLLLLLYSWPAALIYLAFFIIEQQIENNLIQPQIQSKKIKMSALLVFIAILIGTFAGGILGMIVAIPVAGCLMVLFRDMMDRRGKGKTPDGEDDDMGAAVFTEADRKFVKPKLKKIHRKKKYVCFSKKDFCGTKISATKLNRRRNL